MSRAARWRLVSMNGMPKSRRSFPSSPAASVLPGSGRTATLSWPQTYRLGRSSELYLGIEKDLSPSLRDPERAGAARRSDHDDPDPGLERLARIARGSLQVPLALVCVAERERPVRLG